MGVGVGGGGLVGEYGGGWVSDGYLSTVDGVTDMAINILINEREVCGLWVSEYGGGVGVSEYGGWVGVGG